MVNKSWINKALSMCLTITIIAAYSMAALAGAEKIAGEVTISGTTSNGQNPVVKINGENAQSGRSVFTGSIVATPENTTAVINLGQAGKIELAPDTVIDLSFTDNDISGNLSAGRVTVLNASKSVVIKNTEGTVVELSAGESASATTAKNQTGDADGGGGSFLLYAIILGGAAAGIVLAATSDNNRIALGGGSVIVSSTR